MGQNLDEQLRSAQSEKTLAEIKKLQSEQEKIEIEKAILLLEKNKPWWKKINLFQMLLGVGILGFYINYSVIPLANIDNLELKLKNKIDGQKLYNSEQRLIDDTKIFNRYKDSITSELDNRAASINKLHDSRDSLDKYYKGVINLLDKRGSITIASFNEKINQLNTQLKKYQEQISELKSSVTRKRDVIVELMFKDYSFSKTERLFFNKNNKMKLKIYDRDKLVAEQTIYDLKPIEVELYNGEFLCVFYIKDKTFDYKILVNSKGERYQIQIPIRV